MLTKYINEEIRGKVSFPPNLTSKEVARALHLYIQTARKENGLHIVVTNMGILKGEISFEFCAEHIQKKGFLCKKRFIPSRFSIVSVIDFSDSIQAFLQEKSKLIKHHFGTSYNLRIVGQTMKEGDNQILVCVLAEKSG